MRLRNIDILRGLVMILMCIDHARDYTIYHPTDPVDLLNTPFIVFIIRLLAHFCAPTFILLAGISASLQSEKKTKKELSSYLLSRGLILCLLEITLVNWAWSFNPFYQMIFLQVIWALGVSMIVLSQLIYLKEKYIAVFALVIIFGHNLLDSIHFTPNTLQWYIFSFLEQKNIVPITNSFSLRTTYPVLPVIGLIALGYVFGRIFKKGFDIQNRLLILRTVSCISFLLFLLFRMILDYGDPHSIEWFESPLLTLMSLFNVTKYPLSLQFILLSLSVISIFLAFTDSIKVKENNILLILGQVPLFFYVLHIYVLHAIVIVILLIDDQKINLVDTLGGIPAHYGVPLWWLLWIVPLSLLILVPLCQKYRTLKFSRKYKWTSYF